MIVNKTLGSKMSENNSEKKPVTANEVEPVISKKNSEAQLRAKADTITVKVEDRPPSTAGRPPAAPTAKTFVKEEPPVANVIIQIAKPQPTPQNNDLDEWDLADQTIVEKFEPVQVNRLEAALKMQRDQDIKLEDIESIKSEDKVQPFDW